MSKKIWKILIIFGLGAIVAFVIGWRIYQLSINQEYKTDHFKINELVYSDQPFTWNKLAPLNPDFPVDKDGIIIYADQYYHPGQIANQGLFYLDSFHQTNNQEYLVLAKKYAAKLLEIAHQERGSLYFPYPFDFALHGFKDDVVKAPWYSGMTQGEALSLFVRLYEITADQQYLEAAERTFKSFQNLRSDKAQPWTVWVDKEGFYWIEEYPEDIPDQTLNGFIYGLYGLYDFYWLRKDDSSKILIEASLTTLKRYLRDFRNPGGISFYCLKHKRASESYHQTHIKQLQILYQMTGDEYFKTMADNFYQDYH